MSLFFRVLLVTVILLRKKASNFRKNNLVRARCPQLMARLTVFEASVKNLRSLRTKEQTELHILKYTS